MKEIGSEFWKIELENFNNNLDFINLGKDYQLLMSGRTAIDFVINDFQDELKIVYMPNYCCESMMQPFIDNGYKIVYYDFDYQEKRYIINPDINCSVFFAMSYFGYCDSYMDNIIEEFSNKKTIVIEDITHRLLSDNNHCMKSDYLICSLRKWFPIISGGVAIKKTSNFNHDTSNYKVDDFLVTTKEKAMKLKKYYIEGLIDTKGEFLNLYKESNNRFLNYKNKKIDNISLNILKHLNIANIKAKRISNSLIIEKMLDNNKNIEMLFKYKKGDCPLFVPILIKNRDIIRKKMIEKSIYLPVHWPNNKTENKIYDLELSLINDQRYDDKDIKKYINELIKTLGD